MEWYFSTLERLRIIRSPEYNEVEAPAPERLHTPPAALFFDDEENQPTLRLAFGQDELENAPHRRAHIKHNPSRIYASPEKTLRKRRHISCDKPAALRLRKSVILESTEESILQLGNRQLDRSSSGSTISRSKIGKMVSFPTDTTISGSDMTSTTDSMLESFRWLEDGDDLDLRLLLDDNQFISRSEDVPAQSKRNPSFKRHLSISKLTLGGRTSTTMSRPSTKETSAATLAFGSPNGSIPGSPVQGHVRRRSRALSLITPNKQSIPDATTCVDPAAAHYQDPDARMKLRVYLASAHKFDEAVEFGFPAIEEVQGKGSTTHKRAFSQQEQSTSRLGQLRPFEDDKSSMYSDQASTAEPESPKTPETMEKPLPVEAVRGSQDEDVSAVKVDYAPAPTASREMTLRMTLTRPDLRANEEQIYGWQKTSGGRRSQTKDEPQSPVSLAREGHSKESIERQFAAMDQEDLLSNEQGVVKRFWNRVRRS
ncbi:hypothetical protein QQS21_006373 [Conoideocrella luteorostrata]|uniref:Mucin n=1 Tax=Conoideocrella luteorostrata TaxID=1105319 RepID=A0AAJ0CN08_9HYPO|nr:hypothetical protein QQS21_006373 [Conoideocrella luteorostrata]